MVWHERVEKGSSRHCLVGSLPILQHGSGQRNIRVYCYPDPRLHVSSPISFRRSLENAIGYMLASKAHRHPNKTDVWEVDILMTATYIRMISKKPNLIYSSGQSLRKYCGVKTCSRTCPVDFGTSQRVGRNWDRFSCNDTAWYARSTLSGRDLSLMLYASITLPATVRTEPTVSQTPTHLDGMPH